MKDEKKEKKTKQKETKKCECGCEQGGKCECECCKEKDTQIEELTKKLADMTELAARSQAEVINYKKRKDEETALRLKYSNEDILKRFVEICDNFERAIRMDDNDLTDEVSKFLEGFKMMYGNMQSILEENEVKEIDVLGKAFDANTSEAVIVEHTEGKEPNEVIEVLRKGYTYKDKLLRPAMVKIND